MRDVQGEPRPVVVEGGQLPGGRGVAGGAILRAARGQELPAVGILRPVAAGAPAARGGEVGSALERAVRGRGAGMALDTTDCLVRSFEAKTGSGMVECAERLLLPRGVTGLAPDSRLVRIAVARGAGSGKTVLPGSAPGGLVTVAAGHGGVAAGQGKSCLFVLFEGKRGRLESRGRVAVIAAVLVRRAGEFAAVAVLVAGGTGPRRGDIGRVAAGRLMALGAAQRGVLSFQGKRAAVVRLAIEAAGLEARLAVTGGAIGPPGPRGELAAVRIFMAVPAALVRDRFSKIGALVTGGAARRRVFAGQRERCGLVAEVRAGPAVLPAAGIMAVLAGSAESGFLERSAMRIAVAALARAVGQAFEAGGLRGGARAMALLAGDRLVQSRQRKTGAAVAEAGSRFPGRHRMAAATVRAELAAMPIFVAGQAGAAQTQEGAVEVPDFDLGTGRGRDALLVVAGGALLLAMLAFQREPGPRSVIELLALQANQSEFAAVMFHVTAHAIGLSRGGPVGASVITGMGLDAPPDLGMTLQALEAARAGAEIVARGALRHAFELLVRAGQRPRRDLRIRRRHVPACAENGDEETRHQRQKSSLNFRAK